MWFDKTLVIHLQNVSPCTISGRNLLDRGSISGCSWAKNVIAHLSSVFQEKRNTEDNMIRVSELSNIARHCTIRFDISQRHTSDCHPLEQIHIRRHRVPQ